MNQAMNLWVLSGIAVMIAGFALRLNPLLVVAAAASIDQGIDHSDSAAEIPILAPPP